MGRAMWKREFSNFSILLLVILIHLSTCYVFRFIYLCLCIYVHLHVGTQSPKSASDHQAGVTCNCELPSVGPDNHIPALCKSSKCF